MYKCGLVVLILSLVGCAQIVDRQQADFDKSGSQEGDVLSCGHYKTWRDCYTAAEKACASGYKVLSKEENLVMQSRVLRIQCAK